MTDHLPKAILFDMDDTILAYSQNSDYSWQVACHTFVSSVENLEPETLLHAIKTSAKRYWSDPERHRIGRLHLDVTRQQIVGAALQEIGRENSLLARNIALAYAAHREATIEPFPDAINTLRELGKRDVRMALLRLNMTRLWFVETRPEAHRTI